MRAIRGGSSAGLGALLAVAAVGGGVYYVAKRADRPPPRDDSIAQIAALARVEKDSEWIQRAVREGRAILGMTYREVQDAKGPPLRKERDALLSASLRARGGVENWVYETGGRETNVLFNIKGLVIQSSDVGEKPQVGQAVRQ